MPQGTLHRLTAKQVEHYKGPGKLADGGGLYLKVRPDGGRQWVYRYTRPDQGRGEMGLGSASAAGLDLKDARQAAEAARAAVKAGVDPIRARQLANVPKAKIPTFGEFADTLAEQIETEFRNLKHRAQWKMTLGDRYCAAIRRKRVDEITSEDVFKVLQPIWLTKAETASRVRGRIERVLDAAKAQGLRSGDNPAIWRGGLKATLSKRHKLQRGHHTALPFADMPPFMQRLREGDALGARALEFTILTAARSGETRGARWSEIDLKEKLWTIPESRMKAGKAHCVPLSDRAVAILNEMAPLARQRNDLVFPGQKEGKPMSDMTLGKVLKRMKVCHPESGRVVTVHGFRSSFRDWAAEATTFSREAAEKSLAHSLGSETEVAYLRTELLQMRRQLLAAWEQFCLNPEPKAGGQVANDNLALRSSTSSTGENHDQEAPGPAQLGS